MAHRNRDLSHVHSASHGGRCKTPAPTMYGCLAPAQNRGVIFIHPSHESRGHGNDFPVALSNQEWAVDSKLLLPADAKVDSHLKLAN